MKKFNPPLPPDSSIHILPSRWWSLGIPASKSEKKTDKNCWSATRIYPVKKKMTVETTLNGAGGSGTASLSPHLNLVTETSGGHLHTQAGLLSCPSPPKHKHKDPGFDSKKSKRGWGWKWNKTSCEQFISEARWWKHEACYIFLFSPSKKRKLRSHMDLALHFLLFLKPCKEKTGSWGQCFSRKTPGIPRSLGQEGGQTVSRCPAQAGLLS